MTTAWISGHAGRAIVYDGEGFFRLEVASPERLSADATHLHALLAWGFAVEEWTGADLTEERVRERLRTLWRCDRVETMVRGAADPEVPAKLRERAVALASRHLTDHVIREMVRRRLYASVLPPGCADVGPGTDAGELLAELASVREPHASVLESWEEARRRLLVNSSRAEQYRMACIEAGGVVVAVRAVVTGNPEAVRAWLRDAGHANQVLADPEASRLVAEWVRLVTDRVHAAPAAFPATGIHVLYGPTEGRPHLLQQVGSDGVLAEIEEASGTDAAGPLAPPDLALAEWTRALRPSTISAMMGHMARPGVISFALGLPAPELFPVDDYLAAAERVLRSDTGALQYRAPHGPLKEQVAALMRRRGVACTPQQVFLTTGAQQALALLARLFLEPGGPVICDRLVYMGFQQVVESYSPRILAVDSDLETGMDVDQVEAHLERGPRPAFIYCITDGHNPLGVSVSLEKRLRLAELACRHRVPLIEDDAYGLLHYGQPLPPIRALEDRWVFYVGSFSKVLAPGFRAGWLVVPEELVSVLGCAKDGADIDTSTFSQRLVSAYLEAGGFEAHLGRIRAAYREKRDVMLGALARHFPAGTRWSVPRHGALVWAELPEGMDAAALLPDALEHEGVAYVPGNAFSFDGRAGTRAMRLNFSFPSVGQIELGMARLGRSVREAALREPSKLAVIAA